LVAGCGGDEKTSFTQANIKVTQDQGVQLLSSAEGTANRSFSSARLSDAKGEQIMAERRADSRQAMLRRPRPV